MVATTQFDLRAVLATLADTTNDAVFVKDLEGRYLYMNAAGAAMLGQTQASIAGMTDSDVFEPETAESTRAFDRLVLASEQTLTVESYSVDIHGRAGTYLSTKGVFRDANGLIAGIVGHSKEITDRKQAEVRIESLVATLEQRKVALEDSNRELTAFSYAISQDLRTPLRAIEGFARLLKDDCGSCENPLVEEHVARIAAGVRQMNEIIDGLLALAHAGHAELHASSVDLAVIAREVAEALAAGHPDRHVVLELEGDFVVWGDPALLRIVVNHLLDNAWKFTSRQADPRVSFSAHFERGEQLFEVHDNGAGFELEHAERLFLPFARLHTSSEFPGRGMGLATVSRILGRHGGRIWADARTGVGATFYFTMPRRDA